MKDKYTGYYDEENQRFQMRCGSTPVKKEDRSMKDKNIEDLKKHISNFKVKYINIDVVSLEVVLGLIDQYLSPPQEKEKVTLQWPIGCDRICMGCSRIYLLPEDVGLTYSLCGICVQDTPLLKDREEEIKKREGP